MAPILTHAGNNFRQGVPNLSREKAASFTNGLVDAHLEGMSDVRLKELASDQNKMFYYYPDLYCPLDRVAVAEESPESYKIVAQKKFMAGDLVYTNQSLLFPATSTIVIEILGFRKVVDNIYQTVNRGNGIREFFFFDTFQNHSCDPNTEMIYHPNSDTAYDIIALRDINEGDEITCDYETFDQLGLDGSVFNCECGAAKCRGEIKA